MGIDTRSQYNDVCFGYTLVPSQYHGIHIIGTHTRSTSLSCASNKLSPYIEADPPQKADLLFWWGPGILGRGCWQNCLGQASGLSVLSPTGLSSHALKTDMQIRQSQNTAHSDWKFPTITEISSKVKNINSIVNLKILHVIMRYWVCQNNVYTL